MPPTKRPCRDGEIFITDICVEPCEPNEYYTGSECKACPAGWTNTVKNVEPKCWDRISIPTPPPSPNETTIDNGGVENNETLSIASSTPPPTPDEATIDYGGVETDETCRWCVGLGIALFVLVAFLVYKKRKACMKCLGFNMWDKNKKVSDNGNLEMEPLNGEEDTRAPHVVGSPSLP